MAETVNISEMASRVARDIFGLFGWKRVGPADVNWPCVRGSHERSTHPSDAVFWYDDPYTEQRIYLNTDFKSYGRTSISKASIGGAISNLIKTTECANVSPGWKEKFFDGDESHRVIGLLFVYNHDEGYDDDFAKLLDDIDPDNFAMEGGTKCVVLGPSEIAYLSTVANDIVRLRADAEAWKTASFYYPDLVLSRARNNEMAAASIEQLLGSWCVLSKRKSTDPGRDYVIYYRESGRNADEFKYLIDFLFRYQMLGEYDSVVIRAARPDPRAPTAFSHAKEQYAANFPIISEIKRRLDQVAFESVTNIVTRFSADEIGMIRG